MLYPNGIEVIGDEVYINCICGLRIFWMKRYLNPLKKFNLPEGWSHLSPIHNGKILCPICGKHWDKNCESSSVGRTGPCQGSGRRFEPDLSLHY